MESLGDRWGREVRYGQAIQATDEVEGARRANIVDWMMNLSALLRRYEQASVALDMTHIDLNHPNLEHWAEQGRAIIQDHADFHDAVQPAVDGILRRISEAIQTGIDLSPVPANIRALAQKVN